MIHGVIMAMIVGYGFGSIPFGLVLTRLAGLGDIRDIGSGNIGATNVLRTGNKPLALATLILDSGKGALAIAAIHLLFYVRQGRWMDPEHAVLFGLIGGGAAILGHCFPVWLKFKGGKGVATTLGTLLAAVPLTGLIACAAWLASAFLFRISSLAALLAMIAAPVATFFIYGPAPAVINLLISLLVYIRHKDNIKRLIKGEEPKIGTKKPLEPKADKT